MAAFCCALHRIADGASRDPAAGRYQHRRREARLQGRDRLGRRLARPGELVAQFSIGDYLHAFRSGLSGLANGYMLLYLLLGAVGLAARPPRELLELALLTLLYIAFHFLLFPSSQERFMGPVYIGLGILGATAVSSIAATSRTAKAAA